MKNLSNPFWIKLKGLLFLFLGIVTSVLLFLDRPALKTALLLALAIWSFCRVYYFAFYVIGKYIEPGCKFSGLLSFARHRFQRKMK
jgi:hypothetical protein